MAKRKKRKQNKSATQDGCILDGCYYMPVDGCAYFDFDGGCLEFDGGCLDIGDGCAAFDGGCLDIGSGCTMLTLFPLRLFVIIGLMLYGDWDFKHHRAKSHNLLD